MVHNAYRPAVKRVYLRGAGDDGDGESRAGDGDDAKTGRGPIVEALTFLSKPEHPQFAPPLSLRDITAVVIGARGKGGRNRDYVLNTARHLSALDIERTEIHRVADNLRRIT